VYVKLRNGYVMIAKIKIKSSLKKAGLPRDEGYILSLCSLMSHPFSKLFVGYTRCAVASTKLITIFASLPFDIPYHISQRVERILCSSSRDPTSQSAVFLTIVKYLLLSKAPFLSLSPPPSSPSLISFSHLDQHPCCDINLKLM
jgi:hypothetical protein